MSALVLYVRLHEGRYHGRGDWPPSPARLFQALVAGAGLGGPIGSTEKKALEWLENQQAPLLAAPLGWQPRKGILFYMPNNDSDAIGGDPLRMSKIRTATKTFRPHFFDATVPFLYVWALEETADNKEHASAICSLAERLYQLGRGIDIAWAWGEVLDEGELDALLTSYPGRIFRPSAGKSAISLLSPCPGSFASLDRRHQAFGERFQYVKAGKSVQVVFRKPPKPRFQLTPYDSPPSRQLYELRSPIEEGAFAPWPLTRTTALVVQLRDAAVERLKKALPTQVADIERVLVGRKPDGTNDCPPERRVRIIPLPSIGHVHADREIRRVLVEVPPACPLRADDVYWAFSGLDLIDMNTGIEAVLIRAQDEERAFLRHYGADSAEGHRVWRTVTPAALPAIGQHRGKTRTGTERRSRDQNLASSVIQALRHAGVQVQVDAIRVQREPFEAKGARAEEFAPGTRFAKEHLWHVELLLRNSINGPLTIGNGRFLGLGVMAPVNQRRVSDAQDATLASSHSIEEHL